MSDSKYLREESPKPHVYVASAWEQREEARKVADALRSGAVITSRWLYHEDPGPTGALMDITDIRAATYFVMLNPPQWHRGGQGGRHFEMGAAFILGKHIALIGERSHIFCELEAVKVFSTVEGYREWLFKMSSR